MQGDIIDVLERAKKPLSRMEIATKLGENPKCVSMNIKRLLDHNEIKFIDLDKDLAIVQYKTKRRLRLYYI